LVLLHGVGTGLLPYLGFIMKLAQLGRPLIIPEAKHVSMRLTKVTAFLSFNVGV
jgi:hypothetical protein